jgi:hypothetical protein
MKLSKELKKIFGSPTKTQVENRKRCEELCGTNACQAYLSKEGKIVCPHEDKLINGNKKRKLKNG